MKVLKVSRLTVLLLCAAVAFGLFYASSAITPSFASEGDGHEDEAPTLESLTERIVGLESRIAELELYRKETTDQVLAYPVFDAIAAVYLLDQVDIHALHGRLHDGEGIMPGDSGQIKRLVPLLSAVNWPSELAEEATKLAETLTQLTEALADDNLETAVPLASAAHEEQHHFSGSVADWFACLLVPDEEMEAEDQEQDEQTESSDDGHSQSHDDDETSYENGGDTENENCDNDESNETQDDGHSHSHGG